VAEYRELLQAVIDHPTDHARKLILADWLEEKGNGAVLTFAMRWCGIHGRHPGYTPHRKFYRWATLLRGQNNPAWPHQLPRIVYAAFRPKPASMNGVRFRSAEQAFVQLGRALEQLREAVAI
jgi:uncharacterized protein (TIGR02996 family)